MTVWPNVPPEIQAQVQGLIAQHVAHFGAQLVGVYLHGSLALGGFIPAKSDLDLLVVLQKPLTEHDHAVLGGMLLAASAKPCPIEISYLTVAQLKPWRFPTLFEYPYSEDYREALTGAQGLHLWHKRPIGSRLIPTWPRISRCCTTRAWFCMARRLPPCFRVCHSRITWPRYGTMCKQSRRTPIITPSMAFSTMRASMPTWQRA
jgi:hypothetical protein